MYDVHSWVHYLHLGPVGPVETHICPWGCTLPNKSSTADNKTFNKYPAVWFILIGGCSEL